MAKGNISKKNGQPTKKKGLSRPFSIDNKLFENNFQGTYYQSRHSCLTNYCQIINIIISKFLTKSLRINKLNRIFFGIFRVVYS
jgi:hypothetical protein